jgi:hypothetical protein
MSAHMDYDPELSLWVPGRRRFLFLLGAAVVAPSLPTPLVWPEEHMTDLVPILVRRGCPIAITLTATPVTFAVEGSVNGIDWVRLAGPGPSAEDVLPVSVPAGTRQVRLSSVGVGFSPTTTISIASPGDSVRS